MAPTQPDQAMTTEKPKHDITLDTSGLEAPEPLERVLEALSTLDPRHCLRMLIDREPRPLYAILDQNDFSYEIFTTPEYHYEIFIRHKN
jgi:uncharacterized protein (DUF2249 family)